MRIAIDQLKFEYGPERFRLEIPDLQIESGARVAFVGPSGSGKTTLLRLLAGIVTPQSGTVTVGEVSVNELTDAGRRAFRIRHIGFVFQDFRLVEHLDVRENILLPYRLNEALPVYESIESQVKLQAARLDLADKLDSPINELSQGEQQRVAICRALLPRPELLLADEPTGNLDPKNKDRILDQLFQQAESAEATLVMVTHDHALLDRFDRVIDFTTFHKPEATHQ
ncbi:MAG: ABC transporter ATP-binding protein [Verrucomicrobia subdivision 3 bacterium]|nr:ABC transporter ATP-binding protein [Limisphaerales bacterium]